MDFQIQRGSSWWALHATSTRADDWLLANYSSRRDVVRPAAEGGMLVRMLLHDDFDIAIESSGLGDFADHRARLTMAKARPINGTARRRLTELAALREDVDRSCQPASLRLLPEIDVEIRKLLDTEAPTSGVSRPRLENTNGDKSVRARAGRIEKLINRAIHQLETVSVRLMISILLMIHIWQFASSVVAGTQAHDAASQEQIEASVSTTR